MPNRGSPWIVAVVLAAGGAVAWRLGERPPRATTEKPAAPATAPVLPTSPPAPSVVEAPRPAPIDLRLALSAFRSLAPADWRVRDDTFSPKGGGGPFADLPKEDFAAAAAAFRDGASVRLESPYGHATIVGNAIRFVDAPRARAFLDVERRLAEAADAQRKAWFAALPSPDYVDGAGPNGSLAGFGESIRRPDRGYEGLREVQVFVAGPVVFELAIDDVGGLDAARVEAAVAAAAAYVTDPARPVPAVVPLPAGVAWVRWEGLVVSLFGPDGTPVAGGSVAVIESGAAPKVTRVEIAKGLAFVPVRPIGGSLYLSGAAGPGGEQLAPRHAPSPFPADGRVELHLAAAVEVEGVVVDPAGHGLANVALEARPRAVPDEARFVTRATSGAEGAFRFVGLGDEEYALTVRPVRGLSLPEPRTVRGGSRGLRLELTPGDTVTLTVVDQAGVPVAGASVRVLDPAGAPRASSAKSVEADSSGNALLPALDKQVMDLGVYPPQSRPDLAAVRLNRWMPRDETITLHPFFNGIVRVVDESGKPERADVLRDENDVDGTKAMGDVIGGWAEKGVATRENGWALLERLDPERTRVGVRLDAEPGVFPSGVRYAIISPERPQFTLQTARTGKTLVVRARGGAGPQSVLLISADVHGALPDIVRSSMTNADGVATFEKVAPGAFRVFVLGDPATGGPAGRIQIVGFTGQVLDVSLVPSQSIRVHAPSTGPATKILCKIGLPARFPLPMTPKEGDVHELAGLPPGRYTVAVEAEFPGTPSAYADYEVEAGATLEVRVGDHVIERVEK